jgi:hypothetical protein
MSDNKNYLPTRDLSDKIRRAGFTSRVIVKNRGKKVLFALIIGDENTVFTPKNDSQAGVQNEFTFAESMRPKEPGKFDRVWIGMYKQAAAFLPVRTFQNIDYPKGEDADDE